MRRTALVLFVVLYCAATAVAAGRRSAGAAHRFLEAGSSQTVAMESSHAPCAGRLPQFGHAKSIKVAAAVEAAQILDFPAPAVQPLHVVAWPEYSGRLSTDRISARSPPRRA